MNRMTCILIPILFFSCVSQSEHDKVVSSRDAIKEERDKLKEELNEIKFGAPSLLLEGKKFYQAKDFAEARNKFQTLVEKHPDMPQSIEAKKYLFEIDEEELWKSVSTSEDITFTEKYINDYPNGKYISKAKTRRTELRKLNMQTAYDAASNQNTSYAWKNFLEDYPDHDEASLIKERIIRLEVDEISGNRETREIPSFNQVGSSYASNSSVEITNNTGCELTVRYSGVDAKIIVISVGETRSVSLSSGSYKIAASACGANYAGVEDLQGEYRSTFYISTRRY
jgi:hypothetical protein